MEKKETTDSQRQFTHNFQLKQKRAKVSQIFAVSRGQARGPSHRDPLVGRARTIVPEKIACSQAGHPHTGIRRGPESEQCPGEQEPADMCDTWIFTGPAPSCFVILLPPQLQLRFAPHVLEFSQKVAGFYLHILSNYLVI